MSVQVFEKYQVLRRLAIGGMGEIFLARQQGVAGFDRLVILKSLLRDLARDHSFVEQFLDEARVAATLNHPNIVSIFEVGAWRGLYFIAMEYIDGLSLAELLFRTSSQRCRVPYAIACRIVREAALALDHAHKAKSLSGEDLGIVHRDVSPQNIMVRTDGVTKVVDFGIAKAANRNTRTATGALKGKIAYMSPEQVASEHLDGRSDQFSLGVVFWELCAGKRLFRADSPVTTLQRITELPIPRLSDALPRCPAEVERIVMKMLEREPGRRFTDCGEVAQALDDFLRIECEDGGRADVSTFLREHTSDDDKNDAVDLTPAQPDFLIDLADHDLEATVDIPSRHSRVLRSPPRSKLWVVIALLVLTSAGVALWASRQLKLWGSSSRDPLAELATESLAEPVVSLAEPADVPAPTLILRSKPQSAQVFVDDVLTGRTPLDLSQLVAGDVHAIRIELDGYTTESFEVQLREGETRERVVTLNRRPPTPTPATTKKRDQNRHGAPSPSRVNQSKTTPNVTTQKGTGYLTINTKPWTLVSVNGEAWGSTPLFRRPTPSGKYRVRFRNEQSGIDETRSVVVKPGQNLKLVEDLRR